MNNTITAPQTQAQPAPVQVPFIPGYSWDDEEFLALTKDQCVTPLEQALWKRLAASIETYEELDQQWREYARDPDRFDSSEPTDELDGARGMYWACRC